MDFVDQPATAGGKVESLARVLEVASVLAQPDVFSNFGWFVLPSFLFLGLGYYILLRGQYSLRGRVLQLCGEMQTITLALQGMQVTGPGSGDSSGTQMGADPAVFRALMPSCLTYLSKPLPLSG